MKLSKNNFCEMVTQLIRDKDKFEKLIKKPIFNIGFINSKNIRKNDIKVSKDGINKLNKFYNWKGIEKINKLEEDVKLLGDEVMELRN